MRGVSLSVCLLIASVGVAAPAGFVKTTIPLNGLPVGLAFDNGGTLYALEGASFGDNVATLRVIHTDGTFGGSFPVAGDDTSNFFVGSMAYDAVGNRLLVSDNTADGRLYAISKTGEQRTIAQMWPALRELPCARAAKFSCRHRRLAFRARCSR